MLLDMVKILIVDDEPSVTDLLSYNLRKANYEVLVAEDGPSALALAESENPDLILLDLMLPVVDGLDVCRTLRRSSQVPIIMITALGEETDRVVGLELGADDYICKPFSIRELLARIKAVLRRTQDNEQDVVGREITSGPGGLRMEHNGRKAFIGENPLDLTKLEFDLLYHLLNHPGQVFSRERLLEEAWGFDYPGNTRAVDSAIKRLRAKLKTCSPEAEIIETVRGIGYRLKG
jgi:DNA-binding response OmpR family regulator